MKITYGASICAGYVKITSRGFKLNSKKSLCPFKLPSKTLIGESSHKGLYNSKAAGTIQRRKCKRLEGN
jgi:hypothetical protein